MIVTLLIVNDIINYRNHHIVNLQLTNTIEYFITFFQNYYFLNI